MRPEQQVDEVVQVPLDGVQAGAVWQRPDWHVRPVQQDDDTVHAPSARVHTGGGWQRPDWQVRPAQHAKEAEQVSPASAQVGGGWQRPARQVSPAQHTDAAVHAAPLATQGGPQLPARQTKPPPHTVPSGRAVVNSAQIGLPDTQVTAPSRQRLLGVHGASLAQAPHVPLRQTIPAPQDVPSATPPWSTQVGVAPQVQRPTRHGDPGTAQAAPATQRDSQREVPLASVTQVVPAGQGAELSWPQVTAQSRRPPVLVISTQL